MKEKKIKDLEERSRNPNMQRHECQMETKQE